MFFNQNNSNYFCEELRLIIDPKFKNKFINEFNEKLSRNDYKKKLKSIYNSKLINKNNSFEYYWKILLKRYEIFKNKKEFKKVITDKSLHLEDKLNKINFFYPFIYSYSKKNKFYLCVKWPNIDEEIFIINEDKQILNQKNFNNCQRVRGNKIKKIILGNLEFYYPKEKIKIYTSIIGNLNDENYIQ